MIRNHKFVSRLRCYRCKTRESSLRAWSWVMISLGGWSILVNVQAPTPIRYPGGKFSPPHTSSDILCQGALFCGSSSISFGVWCEVGLKVHFSPYLYLVYPVLFFYAWYFFHRLAWYLCQKEIEHMTVWVYF